MLSLAAAHCRVTGYGGTGFVHAPIHMNLPARLSTRPIRLVRKVRRYRSAGELPSPQAQSVADHQQITQAHRRGA
jgi:hypothetical protein